MKKKKEVGQEQQPKKHGVRNGVIIAAVIIILAAIVSSTGNKDETEVDTATAEPTVVAETVTDENTEPDEEAEYTLLHGDLMSTTESENENGSVLVIKAKIEAAMTDRGTVTQNFYDVEDLIKNQGATDFDELQYWAVADLASGEESKIISFTVSSDVMDAILNSRIPVNQLEDYVDDYWILPSLADTK